MKKISITIISVLSIIIIFLLFSNANNKANIDEIEYLKQKSIAISLATYTGSKNILEENSTGKATTELIDKMTKNTNDKVQVEKININASHKEGNKIVIITGIQEVPFKTILFHQFTYENINGKWLIVDFGLDA